MEVVVVGKLVRDYERQVALDGDASMVLRDLTSYFRYFSNYKCVGLKFRFGMNGCLVPVVISSE